MADGDRSGLDAIGDALDAAERPAPRERVRWTRTPAEWFRSIVTGAVAGALTGGLFGSGAVIVTGQLRAHLLSGFPALGWHVAAGAAVVLAVLLGLGAALLLRPRRIASTTRRGRAAQGGGRLWPGADVAAAGSSRDEPAVTA